MLRQRLAVEVSGGGKEILQAKRNGASSPGKYSRATFRHVVSYGIQDRIPIIMMCPRRLRRLGNPSALLIKLQTSN